MTIKELMQDWNDYHKTGIYEGQRFGQYVFNVRGYEYNGSYNIENADVAFSTIYESLSVGE